MPSNLEIFHSNLALPADGSPSIEIKRAEGMYLYDQDDKKYLDLNSGICVNNLGHQHPKVQEAIKDQLDKFSHVMVYGQMVLEPQLKLAKVLADLLPDSLSCNYFVNSGSEAVEGSLKLAKRYTGRSKIISCSKAYHGSTHGALSIMGGEYFKQAYRPLLPDTHLIEFNNQNDLELIDTKAACVVIEPIQGEDGRRIDGSPIEFGKPPKEVKIKFLTGVAISNEGKTLTATVDGRVRINHQNQVSVENVYTVLGDVGPETGNIDFVGCVAISGSVGSGFIVKSAETVLIRGHVEGAVIDAAKGITVHGGIAGAGKATLKTPADIRCRYAQDATLI
ncbi:MAG: hypothetical protein COC01_00630, partial [Bacteroidetes bacterium]